MSYTITSKSLTSEQLRRMEENKKKAMLLQQKQTNSNLTIGKCVPFEEDSNNRFEVIVGYNKELIEIFKTISSRKYEPNTKRWNFLREHHDELLTKVQSQLNNVVKLEPLTQVLVNTNFF
jgi:hypothetical protein